MQPEPICECEACVAERERQRKKLTRMVPIRFDGPGYDRASEAARKAKLNLSEFIRSATVEKADEVLAS